MLRPAVHARPVRAWSRSRSAVTAVLVSPDFKRSIRIARLWCFSMAMAAIVPNG